MASPGGEIPQNKRVGYRFHPTGVELVGYFLKHKLLGNHFLTKDIAEVDVCAVEPWELPAYSKVKSDDPEWFFFSPRGSKNPNSNRSNRKTKAGYWKVTGKDRNIKTRGTNNVIGIKKTLVFYRGRVPHGIKTNWVIHEYHAVIFPISQRTFVLCHLKKKAEEEEDALIYGQGDPSSSMASICENQASSDRILDAYSLPEVNPDSIFQAGECAFPSVQQESSFQHASVPNAYYENENNSTFLTEEYDFPSIQQEPFFQLASVPSAYYENENNSIFLTEEYDFPSIQPEASFQYASVPNAYFENENNTMRFVVETTEEEDNVDELLNSIFVDEDVSFREARRNAFASNFAPSESSRRTDTELVSAQYGNIVGPSSALCNEDVCSRNFQVMCMLTSYHGVEQARTPLLSLDEVNQAKKESIFQGDFQRVDSLSYDLAADRHSDNLVSQRYAARRSQIPRKVSSKAASLHEVKKETHTQESKKDQRKAQGTSSRKNMETTSHGGNGRGSFICLETPSLLQNPSPRSTYLVNIVTGFSLLIVAIWDVISSGKYC